MRYWSKNTCLTGSALFLTIWEYITMLTDWKAEPIEPESKHLNLLWIPILTSISISVFEFEIWILFYLDFFAISSSFFILFTFKYCSFIDFLPFPYYRISRLSYSRNEVFRFLYICSILLLYSRSALYVWIQAKFSHTSNDFWNSANIKLRCFTVEYTKF